MKKNKIFLIAGLVTALAVGTITTIALTSTQTSEVDAAYNDNVSVLNNLWVKVTDPSTIQNNEQLLIVGNRNQTVQYFVGASYHYWITTEGSELPYDAYNDNYMYLNNNKGELVTFEKNGDGSFYLKLDHFIDNVNRVEGGTKSGYLVHEAYNNDGVTAFGDLYFREKKDKPSADAARWNLEYVDGHMRIVSKTNRLMIWKEGSGYMWNAFIASTHTEWNSNINLYRRAIYPDVLVSVTHLPYKVEYTTDGEDIDLTGLEVEVASLTNVFANSSYNSEPGKFEPLYISYTQKTIHFTWCGLEGAFSIDVIVTHDRSDEHLYEKSDTKMTDLRGSYILGFEYENPDYGYRNVTCTLNVSSISSGSGADADYEGIYFDLVSICDNYYGFSPALDRKWPEVVNNVVQISLGTLPSGTPGYFIKIGDNSLTLDNSKLKLGGLSLNTSNIVANDENNYIYIGQGIGNEYQIVFDTTLDKVTTVARGSITIDQIPLCLYKLKLTDNLPYDEEIETFRASFFSKTSAYDATASSKNVTKANWDSLASLFNALSLDAQGYIASLTYSNHNHETTSSLEDMVDRYDSILNTYYNVSGFSLPGGDFMNRNLAGTYQNNRGVTLNGINCTVAGNDYATYALGYIAVISPDTGYANPETIEIMMDDNELEVGTDYSYNPINGSITINPNVITADIIINVEAIRERFVITYVAIDNEGNEHFFCDSANEGLYTLLTYAEAGLTDYAPSGRQFKCWQINGANYQDGENVDISDDLVVTAVYESSDPVINQLEERTATIPYLSYDYTGNAIDGFTFSNITIRYRSVIAQGLWEELNGDDDNIEGYGVLFTTEENLYGAELKNLYDIADESSEDDIYNFRSKNVTPTLLSADDYDEIKEDSYSWNLRVSFTYDPLNLEKLTTRYVAVGYIVTKNNGVIFLKQSTTSVKDLAQIILDSDDYDEESLNGSLSYLANL